MCKLAVVISCLTLFVQAAYSQYYWKELNSPVSIELKSGFFMDDEHAIAVGEDGTIIYSFDGGQSWAGQQDKEKGWIWTADFKPGGSFAIAGGSNGLLMKSTDYGEFWTEIPTGLPQGSFIFGSQVIDENVFYIAGGEAGVSGWVMKTTSGGSTWKKMPVDSTYFLDQIVFVNELTGFTSGITEDGIGKIFKTSDAGETWVLLHTIDTAIVSSTSLSCPTEQVCYATAALSSGEGLWLRSTDAGATWDEQINSDHQLLGNSFIDPLHGFSCGTGVILTTSDGGMQWVDAGYSGAQNINSVQALTDGAFAVGTGGTLLTYVQVSSVDERSLTSSMMVYPNPARRGVYIRLTLSAQEQQLIIYDVLGRVIYTTFFKDKQELFFERGGLASGVYHYFVSMPDGKLVERGSFIFE